MTNKEALERLKQPFSATPDTDSYFDAKEVAMKSLEKDLSIVKELEKIKAEIMSIGNWREHYEMPIAYLSCLTIVEHHISELKGENK